MSSTPLSRRTLLGQAAKAAIGLPLLQAMIPASRLCAADPPAPKAVIPRRLCVIYVPHGIHRASILPAQTGRGFPLSPTLEPLAPLAGRFSVVSNLMMDCAGVAVAHRAGEMFLTNERIAEGDRYSPNRLSMDRLVVKSCGGQTLLPSLQLSLSSPAGGTGMRNTISFEHDGTALLGQTDPRAVFEQLFGNADNPDAQRAALLESRSILDRVTPQVQALRRRLGRADQRVLEEHLEAIRETERYLSRREQLIDKPTRPEDQGLTLDKNGTIAERMRNLFDLTFLAFRADLTRVVTFTVFKERADGEQVYHELGFGKSDHHGWSHAYSDARPDTIEEATKAVTTIDRFNTGHLAYFLNRLKDTPEGDGTMLDNTLVVYGSGVANLSHDAVDLPIVIAGGEKLGMRQGQHVRYERPENLTNLNQTLLQIMLGPDRPQWKDSNRVLGELLA